jgi:hypothetical protein
MAKFVFDRIVTGEEIKGLIQEDLGTAFRVEVKKGRLEIEQDGSRGCTVQLRDKDGRTSAVPAGYMPSPGLRAVMVLPVPLVMAFVLLQPFAPLVAGGAAALAVFIALSLMRAPSRQLVTRVSGILGRVSAPTSTTVGR